MANSVVTVAGEVSSGASELAQEISRLLKADFVDRQVIATAAARLGIAEKSVEEKELVIGSLRMRIARVLETFLERSAIGDPTLGPSGVEVLMSRSYDEALVATQTPALTDAKYVDILRSVMLDLAQKGNVVIPRRGGQVLLQGMPGVLHISVWAPHEDRMARLMQREHLSREAAEKNLREADHNRLAYFKKFFKVNPDSPELYHLVINTHLLSIEKAAQVIIQTLAASAA